MYTVRSLCLFHGTHKSATDGELLERLPPNLPLRGGGDL